MDVKEVKKDNCVMQLMFEVPFEDLKKEYELKYKQVKNTLRIPGFRQGKMPDNILRAKALPYIIDDFKENYTEKLFKDYLTQNKINIYSYARPKINKVEFNENEPFKLDIEFEVYPSVELKNEDYSSIKLGKIEYSVTEIDIDEAINNQLKQRRMLENIEITDRPVKIGDTVKIDIVGKDSEGNESPELTIKSYSVNVKEKIESADSGILMLIDEINNRIVGLEKGAKFNFDYTFANDFESESLKGKTFDVNVEIIRVETEKTPEINDELAVKLNFESVEDMRSKLRDNLLNSRKFEGEDEKFKEFLAEIKTKITIDLPLSMIDMVNDDDRKQMESNFAMYNLDSAAYYKMINKTPEQWLIENRDRAIDKIKDYLIVSKLTELEKIEVTKEETDAEIDKVTEQYKMDKVKFKREMIEKGEWESFKSRIAEKKLREHILNNFVEK